LCCRLNKQNVYRRVVINEEFKKLSRIGVKVEEKTGLEVGNMLHRGDSDIAVQQQDLNNILKY